MTKQHFAYSKATCTVCGKVFTRKGSPALTCSKACRIEADREFEAMREQLKLRGGGRFISFWAVENSRGKQIFTAADKEGIFDWLEENAPRKSWRVRKYSGWQKDGEWLEGIMGKHTDETYSAADFIAACRKRGA